MKTCSKCKEEKDESLFTKSKGSKGGIRKICKKCHGQQVKEIRERIPIDTLRVKQREVREKAYKTERYKTWWKSYRQNNKDKIAINIKKWQLNNPEKHRSIVENNKTLVREYQKKYVDELHDVYLKQILKNDFHLVKDYLEVIEIKRIMIKTKRLCRTLNN